MMLSSCKILWCVFQTRVGLVGVETISKYFSLIFPYFLLKKKNPKEAEEKGKLFLGHTAFLFQNSIHFPKAENCTWFRNILHLPEFLTNQHWECVFIALFSRGNKCLLQCALMQGVVWGAMPGITCFSFLKNAFFFFFFSLLFFWCVVFGGLFCFPEQRVEAK